MDHAPWQECHTDCRRRPGVQRRSRSKTWHRHTWGVYLGSSLGEILIYDLQSGGNAGYEPRQISNKFKHSDRVRLQPEGNNLNSTNLKLGTWQPELLSMACFVVKSVPSGMIPYHPDPPSRWKTGVDPSVVSSVNLITWLLVLEHDFYFPYIGNLFITSDYYFQMGWYHQPVL